MKFLKNKRNLIIIGILLVFIIAIPFCIKLFSKKVYLSDEYYLKEEKKEESPKVIEGDLSSFDVEKYDEKTYILFVSGGDYQTQETIHNNMNQLQKEYLIDYVEVDFADYKATDYYVYTQKAPCMFIIDHKEVVSFLDSEKENELGVMKDYNALLRWIKKHVYLKRK